MLHSSGAMIHDVIGDTARLPATWGTIDTHGDTLPPGDQPPLTCSNLFTWESL